MISGATVGSFKKIADQTGTPLLLFLDPSRALDSFSAAFRNLFMEKCSAVPRDTYDFRLPYIHFPLDLLHDSISHIQEHFKNG